MFLRRRSKFFPDIAGASPFPGTDRSAATSGGSGNVHGGKYPNIKICTFMPARSPETTSLDIHPGVFSAVGRRRELLTFKRLHQGRLKADVKHKYLPILPQAGPVPRWAGVPSILHASRIEHGRREKVGHKHTPLVIGAGSNHNVDVERP